MLLDALSRLRQESALSLIVVEQHALMALEIAEYGIIVERGQIRSEGTKGRLIGRWAEIEDMLAVTD